MGDRKLAPTKYRRLFEAIYTDSAKYNSDLRAFRRDDLHCLPLLSALSVT